MRGEKALLELDHFGFNTRLLIVAVARTSLFERLGLLDDYFIDASDALDIPERIARQVDDDIVGISGQRVNSNADVLCASAIRCDNRVWNKTRARE